MRRVAFALLAAVALAGLILWRRSQTALDALPAHVPSPSRPPPRGTTRDELYARAQELDIKGRSKMNKAELAEAVARH